jgi:hypothetical protein
MRSATFAILIAAAIASPVLAKLPPVSDDAKARAAEATSKSAWSDKVGLYKLCLATDHVADGYRKGSRTAGKDAPAPVVTAPCVDPGPYASSVTSAPSKPLEASGMYSPRGMDVSPPGTKATAGENSGGPKK